MTALQKSSKGRRGRFDPPAQQIRPRIRRLLALCCVLSVSWKVWLFRQTPPAPPSVPLSTTWAAADHDALLLAPRLWPLNRAPWTRDSDFWFDDMDQTLGKMQTFYWNGTSWPSTIQWVGAFLDTLLGSSGNSWLPGVGDYDKRLLSTLDRPARPETLYKIFSDVAAYFESEDTLQVFDAAYDDAQWVVLEWLEATKLFRRFQDHNPYDNDKCSVARFAHRARVFYNVVQGRFNTSLCGGGLTWNPALATYKNAITNELFISSSIAMYLYFPGDSNTDPYPSPDYYPLTNVTLPMLPVVQAHDPNYLQTAIKAYDWFKSHNFTNAQGLIVDGFHISKGQTTCDERNEMVYTYNQGVVLSGLRNLWDATGKVSYLVDAYALIDTAINATGWNAKTVVEAALWSGLGRNGIMEDYCDAPATCTQDAQIFKGIYFEHLGRFCELLPTNVSLIPGLTNIASPALAASHASKCRSYLPWVEHNARAAICTHNENGIIGGWWGANLSNHSQNTALYRAATLPSGSEDIRNQPWLLDRDPWACRGGDCHQYKRQRRSLERRNSKRDHTWKQSVVDFGRGRTVETQGSGLGVVKAAYDFSYRAESGD